MGMVRGAGGAPVSPAACPSPVPSAPPPPPPPPAPTAGRRCKLRNFNWEALPAQRVRGRRNLWTTGGRAGGFGLDRRLLEELFGQRPEAAKGGLCGRPVQQALLLDPKKILNLGIFLRQFKRPVQVIVADIWGGEGALYGAEKLLELTKMLPDGEEVKRLEAFQSSQSRLSEAEVFALLLVQVPSYARRLELLVLKEEFFARLGALLSAIQVMTEAATELLNCRELHDLLRLVLEAGNCLNEGGYAGSALGFRMSSLLRLADTKANCPGMDLLHFVALEAEKKDPKLLLFPRKLPHVGPASRILGQEVVAELQNLGRRLQGAEEGLEALDWRAQMGPFLREAGAELSGVRSSLDSLKQATAALCDFFCEEPETFSLAECCRIFQAFGERFLLAAQENKAREAAERGWERQAQARQEKEKKKKQQQQRRSIATCSAQDPGLRDVELDPLFLGGPCRGQRSCSLRGLPPSLDCPQTQERPLPLSRRRTLVGASPCPEPPTPAERAKCLGALPPMERPSPDAAKSLSNLFPKTLLPRGAGSLMATQGSPRDGAGLVGFFHRLSIREKEKPLPPPEARGDPPMAEGVS
ncbi:FH2 domain-containing protein 1-like [Paroedura picta]|uniref:FH2 domain-containing protein 1-like n=1 Tax=Paroedura picta TaxID=143630 RepID=UPI0040579113